MFYKFPSIANRSHHSHVRTTANHLILPSMKKLLNLPLFYRNTCFLLAMH